MQVMVITFYVVGFKLVEAEIFNTSGRQAIASVELSVLFVLEDATGAVHGQNGVTSKKICHKAINVCSESRKNFLSSITSEEEVAKSA